MQRSCCQHPPQEKELLFLSVCKTTLATGVLKNNHSPKYRWLDSNFTTHCKQACIAWTPHLLSAWKKRAATRSHLLSNWSLPATVMGSKETRHVCLISECSDKPPYGNGAHSSKLWCLLPACFSNSHSEFGEAKQIICLKAIKKGGCHHLCNFG